jgi:hypothetical protein
MVQGHAVHATASAHASTRASGPGDENQAGAAATPQMTLNEELRPATSNRVLRSLALRTRTAGSDAFAAAQAQIDNGDEARYSDKSGTYTKGVLQAGVGLVDLGGYATFKTALRTGSPADFEKIILGGPRTLNGPQAGLAFCLDSLDGSQFLVPPAPALASEAYATELVELYWAALLRDVPFGGYEQSSVAQRAAAELSSLPEYAGPRDMHTSQVTPRLLFRGDFAGEKVGPYLSQFLLLPAGLGTLPVIQRYVTNQAGLDFMTDPGEFLNVQNGRPTGKALTPAGARYLTDGRALAALTHADVLYQEYLLAYLVLNTVNDPLPPPLNSGNPYAASKTQNGFGTFGQPDIAATLAAVAGQAIRQVWYQKWWAHLRHRPESGGALVYLQKTGQGGSIEAQVSDTALNSQAVQASFRANSSYFLPQAFPEGSPTHPAYPTGQGTVAGACITVLKFFFDGNFPITSPKVPSADGTALENYHAPAGDRPLTVNSELHKLAHNVSFGHGIHAGIHWRSDTDESIKLGEAVALSYLRDHAHLYNEPFSVSLTKLDGMVATISNA